MNRRIFVALGIAGAIIGTRYFFDQLMKPAPVRNGYILCDLHAHPSADAPRETIEEKLGSPGLIGLTARPNSDDSILTYEKAIDLLSGHPDFQELTPHKLARFKEGYFMRTEEISAGYHHLLVLDWDGEYFPNFTNPAEAIAAIRSQEGKIGLNHPASIPINGKFRLPTNKEIAEITDLSAKVDFIEVHNAHNIRTYLLDNMHEANRFAVELADKKPKYSSSDCHNCWEQVKICGFYIPESSLESMDTFMQQFLAGNVVILGHPDAGPYLSRASFLKGIFLYDLL